MFNPLLLVLLMLSYLIGGVPFAVLIGRQRGVDVLRSGSGNAGAMNTFRTVGRWAGVLVALLDALKAVVAMWLGRWLAGPEAAALCGAAAVAGHCFSPYLMIARWQEQGGGWKMALRRTGGKGLATGMGTLALIDWRLAVAAASVFFLGVVVLRRDETWPTIIAVIVTVPLVWWLTQTVATTIAVCVVSVIVVIKHLPDLREGFWVAAPHK